MLKERLTALSSLRSYLRKPDRSFSGLNLTEERADTIEFVMTPVLEETLGVRRDLPVVWVGQAAPLVNVVAELVYDRGSRVVLLLLGRKPLPFVEN